MPTSAESLQEPAHFGIAEMNVDECFVAMDAAYLAMLGGTEADYLGRHWRVSVHAGDIGKAEEAYRLARATGRGYAEIRALRQDSTIVYQALTVTRIDDKDGGLTGYECVRHDISFYRRDQEVLMMAVDSAPNGLLMINSLEEIQWANRAVEQLFGYTRDELSGCQMDMLMPEHRRFSDLGQREDACRAKDSKTMAGRDLVGLRKDGTSFPLQLYLNRIDGLDGKIVLCTIIDITERVTYQRQLELSQRSAEIANRAKSDFLSRMSHEIRTPMNLIMGMSALLLESPLDEKQRQHVEISYRNVRRLLRLINGILDLSKVEAGMVTLESASFSLKETLGECAATMSAAIEGKGLEFEMYIDPAIEGEHLGDAERLQQVLLNLIGNAVKFTASGKIRLAVHLQLADPDAQVLRFEVQDTGCGIPADKASLVFEPFQQVDDSMGRSYEGTGLGLSIARTLVELMSGKIWLDPTYTDGSKFVFTAVFPLSTDEDLQERKGSSTEAMQALDPGTQILLVEDNPENVFLMRAYLDGLPLSVDFATDGQQAVRKREKNNYHLILMDIQMPIMDGYTATREIRAWEKTRKVAPVPILALTAHAINGAAAQSTEAGCDGHITKPIERNDLVAAIIKFAKRPMKQPETIADAIAARRPAFLANRKSDLIKLREALASADFETIQKVAHNFKGTGTGYGFPEISGIGATMEIAAKGMNAADAEKSIEQLDRCVQSYAAAG